jgi:predicted glycogen debranching enzyme
MPAERADATPQLASGGTGWADFAHLSSLEWLETNGLGGYASSSASGAHTRRYHGLLVAATTPPTGRQVLLSRLEESLQCGGSRYQLASNQYPGAIAPRGFEYLASFRHGLFPVWEYHCGGARLRKTIAAIHGENTTVIVYELLSGAPPAHLEFRPFYAARDYHSLLRAGADAGSTTFHGGQLVYRHAAAVPVHLSIPGATFQESPDWYRNFEYQRERERGFDWREDLYTPGTLTVTLAAAISVAVVVSTEATASRDGLRLFAEESARRESLLAGFHCPLVRTLALAADQFLVRRGEDNWTVIAGYPWFTDWGRDTMIALPGLCLATRRFAEARGILRAFAAAASQGLLPNRFPDHGEQAEYNTVDASLWVFVAVWRYLQATGEDAFVRDEMMPMLEEIVAWHRRGTLHGIHEDGDGLLSSGAEGVQLTWMDAKVGDCVVTPRRGKPVEIQALWINALRILGELLTRFAAPDRGRILIADAERAAQRFVDLFWNAQASCLYDCIAADGSHDASIRPNQVFALSLPFPLLEPSRAELVLRLLEDKLLTPVGLRTLEQSDPRYCPVYAGGPRERDGAYHQGTVWPWLLGPYLTALARYRGASGRQRASEILHALSAHLEEGAVGTVSEIFDGDSPHRPNGCPAQAWSVAELLRAAIEDTDAAP